MRDIRTMTNDEIDKAIKDSFASIPTEDLLNSLQTAGFFEAYEYEEINWDFILQNSAMKIFQQNVFRPSVEVEEERTCQPFSLGVAA